MTPHDATHAANYDSFPSGKRENEVEEFHADTEVWKASVITVMTNVMK
jgi:hypothetical protein